VTLKVSLAGRVSIGTDGVLIEEARFPGRQGRLVFAYLVSEQGRPVFRDELAEALWGGTPPATWEKALAVIASKLRALLGECGLDGAKVLTSAFGCYRLELPDETWIDLLAAAQAADEAEAALAADDPERAKAEARAAVSLARPSLLPGEDGTWVEGKRRELADLLDRALDCLAEACLSSGDPSEAARWAREAIALQPFRESGYRRLMQAHAAAGNRAEALQAYERCRRLLAEELGAFPSPETESIYRELLRTAPAEARAAVTEAGLVSPGRADQRDADPVFVTELGLEPSRELQERERAGPRQDPEPSAPAMSRIVPGWTQGRRGRLIATGGALVLVAAILGAVIALTRADGNAGILSATPNSIAVIDPETNRIVARIPVGDGPNPVGTAPNGVAVGEGAIWVANTDANTVSRIDPAKHAVRQTIAVGGGPAGLAVGATAVWVANGLDGTVSRIDPSTNQAVQTIGVGSGPSGVAYGAGAVWVANSSDGTVSRIDAGTGRVTRILPVAVGATGLAVGFGRVWIASESTGSIAVLDPRSGQVLSRIGVGVDPDAVSAGAGAVWVANRADGTVSKIDPTTGAVTGTIRVGRSPDGIAAGPADVWVANGGDGTLTHIDPANDTVRTVRLTNPPQGLAISADGIYVAVRSSGLEHRGGTLAVLAAQPDFLDLALAFQPSGWSILTMTNDGLVGFRHVGGAQGTRLVPDLAVSLPTPTDGGTTYTFQLRPGLRYSNGQHVQPEDIRAELERVFEIKPAPASPYYAKIVGADRCHPGGTCDLSRGIVTDRAARTITFHLTGPDPDFLTKLALPFAFAVPVGTAAHDLGTHPPPATGPYMIAAYRPKDKTLRLVRNRSFRMWSADAQPRGYPDAISWSWRYEHDAEARVRAVERGAADIALSLAPPLSKQRLGVLAVRHPSQLHMNTAASNTRYFFLNTRVPPFDDVRARRAVNYDFAGALA